MNDDVDGAEDGLSEGTSSFHNVRLWLLCWVFGCALRNLKEINYGGVLGNNVVFMCLGLQFYLVFLRTAWKGSGSIYTGNIRV